MHTDMGIYDIWRGNRFIRVSGPSDGRRASHFRDAGGWWNSVDFEWYFHVEDEIKVAEALRNYYGEVPYWMDEGKDPSTNIAMWCIGGAALLIFLLAAMN